MHYTHQNTHTHTSVFSVARNLHSHTAASHMPKQMQLSSL